MSKRKVAPRKMYRQLDDLRRFVVRGLLGRSEATPQDVYRLVELARRLERTKYAEAPDAE